MPDWRRICARTASVRRLAFAASLAACALAFPVLAGLGPARAEVPATRGALAGIDAARNDGPGIDVPGMVEPGATLPGAPTPEWHLSLRKALTYQGIVVATDQLLYWSIIGGTPTSEVEFLFANAISGVAYFVGFDQVWSSAGFDPPGSPDVSLPKALAYRLFDTARVFAVALAVGTPVSGSIAVTAAIAATRTGIYILHDYAWAWAGARP